MRSYGATGARLVTVSRRSLHSVCLSVYLPVGSRMETAKENGISHFLEHMLFRGTAAHPTPYALNLAVESIGGNLNAATTADTTEYTLSAPSQSAEACVGILADLLTTPRFKDLEVERSVIAEEIREDLDEDGKPIDVDFLSRRRIWPGCPLGQCVTGPIANAKAFTKADLRRWFELHYTAPNAVICVSGAFDEKAVLAAMDEHFGKMRGGKKAQKPAGPALGEGPSYFHADKPGSQTQLRAAFRSVGSEHPDCTAVGILMRLIDDGMATPLHRRIFEEKGLAYNIGAGIEEYVDTGALNFDAVCSHENVVKVLEEILGICKDARDGVVSPDDLARAKQRAIWDLIEIQDSPGALNGWYGEQELLENPRTLAEEAAEVERVDEQTVSRVARSLLTSSRLHVTTVGVQDESARRDLTRLCEGFS